MSEETSVADARHAEVWRVIEQRVHVGTADDAVAVSGEELRAISEEAHISTEEFAQAVAWAERVGFVRRGNGSGEVTLTRKGLEHLRDR
jgi:hypothetical protein